MQSIRPRRAVLDALFGTNGLITCNDIVSFDSFVTQMQSKELLNVPTAFSDYVLRRIFPLMRQNVTSGNSC